LYFLLQTSILEKKNKPKEITVKGQRAIEVVKAYFAIYMEYRDPNQLHSISRTFFF